MHAKGSTNILDLMWGWRVLSPEEPFTQGRPDGDSENNKYLILMTVGETIHQAAANHNKSIYHAFGYASNGRLGATATSTALSGQMNNKARPAGELRLECGGRPTRRATQPPWCRPSRRLRAKSRNWESPVETRQGRPLFPAARVCAHLIGT